MSAWCLFDAHSEDGKLVGYTPETLDDHLRWPGFATAMIAVNWLFFTDEASSGGLILPEFYTHNGHSAKRRAQDADRKKNVRKMSASEADKMRTREEKRREYKEHTPAKAAGFCFKTELLNLGADPTLVSDWLAVRKTKRASNTKTALDAFVREVNHAGFTIDQSLRICCEKSWQGFKADWVKDIKPAHPVNAPAFDLAAYEAKRKAQLSADREAYKRDQDSVTVPVRAAQ